MTIIKHGVPFIEVPRHKWFRVINRGIECIQSGNIDLLLYKDEITKEIHGIYPSGFPDKYTHICTHSINSRLELDESRDPIKYYVPKNHATGWLS